MNDRYEVDRTMQFSSYSRTCQSAMPPIRLAPRKARPHFVRYTSNNERKDDLSSNILGRGAARGLRLPRWRPVALRPAARFAARRDMAANGVTIGSHSMSHPILSHPPKYVLSRAAYDAWLDREIVQSKAEIEGRLGRPVNEFAVPFGAFDRYVYGKIKAAGYTLALNVHGAIADSRADPLNLNSFIVLRSMSMERFLELATSPPLYFDSTPPADLARVEAERTDLSFELDGAEAIDETSVQSHVTSFTGLELRHVKEGDLFVESLDLKRPTYYAVYVTAKDRSGRLCRGAWLFLYDRVEPAYLIK